MCALDRTKCQAGGWLVFGSGKCGWLRSLTPRVCACVLVAGEMPFSSTFSAAAGATVSEMDFPGPRNSGSGDSGYEFVDVGGQWESNRTMG